jgi:release factor glutamine methyltransferase
VLLAILAELPGATGVGTDISPAALEVAAENARRHGLQDRARFAVADGLDGVAGPFDLLVSNPPYIQTSAISALEPEVSRFDPRLALDGGFDGLDAYRRIASGLQSVVPNGWTMFEIGKGQKDAVVSILGVAISPGKAGIIESRMDLSGTTRVVAAKTQD